MSESAKDMQKLASELERRGTHEAVLRELEETRAQLEAEQAANAALAEELSRLRSQLADSVSLGQL